MGASLRTRLRRILRGKIDRLAGAGWPPEESPAHAAPAGAGETIDSTDEAPRAPRAEARATTAQEEVALAILELPPDASAAEVRAAYKHLCKRYHPDRFAGDAERTRVANELLTRINAAYELLKVRRR